MAFEVRSSAGSARCGILARNIRTPALISQTHLGAPPFLLPADVDRMPELDALSATFSDVHALQLEAQKCEGGLRELTVQKLHCGQVQFRARQECLLVLPNWQVCPSGRKRGMQVLHGEGGDYGMGWRTF